MIKCAHCGKQVERVCSNCWRCENCSLDCPYHMERTMNGRMETRKKKS